MHVCVCRSCAIGADMPLVVSGSQMSFEGLCYISKLWKVKLESLLNPGPVVCPVFCFCV